MVNLLVFKHENPIKGHLTLAERAFHV